MNGIKEAHETLDKWYKNGCVGYLIFFHPPGSDIVDSFQEQVIKLREMSDKVRNLVSGVFDSLQFDKAEFFCGKDGKPDRIKVTRRVE